MPQTVSGPDGKPITIPVGSDRKEFIKKVTDANAKAATGEKTEVQAKSEKFGNRMEFSEKTLSAFDKDKKSTIDEQGKSLPGRLSEGSSYLPGSSYLGSFVRSEDYGRYKQARDSFITAMLRDESGAAIGTSEFSRYERELFPTPEDQPAIVAQKRELRKIATEAMKKAAGPGYKSPAGMEDKSPAQIAVDEALASKNKTQVDDLLKKYGGQ